MSDPPPTPSSFRIPAPPCFSSRERKRALSATVGGLVVAFAAPTRITRVRPAIAWLARGTWAVWSAVAARDMEIERRHRLESLLKKENCSAALKKLDSALMELRWTHADDFTNVHATAQTWSEENQLDRRALLGVHKMNNFNEAAVKHYKQRLEQHYHWSAILIKAGLTGITFGALPHLERLISNGHRKTDEVMFGQIPAPVGMDNNTVAVMDGMEDIAWYRGVFEEDATSIIPDNMFPLDRAGKEPFHFETFTETLYEVGKDLECFSKRVQCQQNKIKRTISVGRTKPEKADLSLNLRNFRLLDAAPFSLNFVSFLYTSKWPCITITIQRN
mmetsp:Transcript_22181/g.54274  ORF Transcript_22181/g.54274 Transcript_22181/m.54274 type:complete len:332 (-) Transcript_22181:193-1188(-)